MNLGFIGLVALIRQRLPQLDVRTDQCDMVRIYTPKEWKWMAAFEERSGSYQYGVIATGQVEKFDDNFLRILSCAKLPEFEREVMNDLRERCAKAKLQA